MSIFPLYDLQPFTLVDYPGHVACTLFTGGCNLRCPYCHNANLIAPTAPPRIDEAYLFSFLARRKGRLEGVCITGGEPTLSDLTLLLKRIKGEGYAIKLDTNGTHPERWIPWAEGGLLDYVAMDIKVPLKKYAAMGASPADTRGVSVSVEYLLSHSLPYEFRTTIHPNWISERDIDRLGAYLKGAKRLALQPYTPSEKVLNPARCEGEGYSRETLTAFRKRLAQTIESVIVRGE